MKTILIFFEMVFLHFIADYQVQGILASMKQKSWWVSQFPNRSEFERSRYKNDYKAAMLAHSFEWSFIVLIPMLVEVIKSDYKPINIIYYSLILLTNIFYHYIIDNGKANERNLNLIEDQILHLIAIVITIVLWKIAVV